MYKINILKQTNSLHIYQKETNLFMITPKNVKCLQTIKTAQQLRMHTDLLEDLNLIPSAHIG